MTNLKGKATDKQIAYLGRHGIDAKLFSKQDASDMISDIIEHNSRGFIFNQSDIHNEDLDHFSEERTYEEDMGYPLDFGDTC